MEVDELIYLFYIMVCYEIEKLLISGKFKVKDVVK